MITPCNIVYLSTSGGNFIARMITALNNKEIGKRNLQLHKSDNCKGEWEKKEQLFELDDVIKLITSNNIVKFKHLQKMEKIIFVSTQTQKDRKLLSWRQTFIKNNNQNPTIFHARYQYHYEMKNYLDENKIEYFEIPFHYLFHEELFLNKIIDLANFVSTDIDKAIIKRDHRAWMRKNIIEFKHSKNKVNYDSEWANKFLN